ncbi:MAG: DUF4351 domain-containing protein [Chloroflexota bacterium]
MIPKPFDTTARQLIEADPAAWLRLAGLDVADPVTTIDTELSGAIAIADKVVRVEGSRPWLAHVEIQTRRDPRLLDRLGLYYALLIHRHRLPTRSVILLARPAADAPELTGEVTHHGLDGELRMMLRYDVVRMWQYPVRSLLAGEIATIPLAPLANLGEATPADIIASMARRIAGVEAAAERRALWTATFLLMGLRYNSEQTNALLEGVMNLRDSSTYQAILKEGRREGLSRGRSLGRRQGRVEGQTEGARLLLLRLGTRRFGPPNADITARIADIRELATLERLADRVLDASSWSELLG